MGVKFNLVILNKETDTLSNSDIKIIADNVTTRDFLFLTLITHSTQTIHNIMSGYDFYMSGQCKWDFARDLHALSSLLPNYVFTLIATKENRATAKMVYEDGESVATFIKMSDEDNWEEIS